MNFSRPSAHGNSESRPPAFRSAGPPVIVESGTGMFCRPDCAQLSEKDCGRKAFSSAKEALEWGFNPCPDCRPMDAAAVSGAAESAYGTDGEDGEYSDAADRTGTAVNPHSALIALMDDIASDPLFRIGKSGLRERGIMPDYIDRLYGDAFGVDFQGFLRMRRLNTRFGAVLYSPENGSESDGLSRSRYGDGNTGASFLSTRGSADSDAADADFRTVNRLKTPLGPVMVAASSKGICMLEFAERRTMEKRIEAMEKESGVSFKTGISPFFAPLAEELNAYFKRELKEFSVPLDIGGTDFQVGVWEELRRIRWGETRTYARQAEALGNPKAVRAIARADGENPIGILIPCHRVIGSDGSLTGFSGGLWRKEFLLRLESDQGDLFE